MAISGRHLQFVQAAVKMVRTDCVCSGAQGAPCSLAIFAAHILRRKAPKFVIARREAPLALPLGELSPKVTERALQALPISSGRCSNGTHLRLVIARSEATWQSRSTRYDNRKTIGESVTAFPRLHPKGTSSRFALRAPRPLRGLAMTRREACRIRRGAGTNSQAPPSRVIARSEASLALPLGELSPKVTERALQALLNGNSNQGEG